MVNQVVHSDLHQTKMSVIYVDQTSDLEAALALVTTLRVERDSLKSEISTLDAHLNNAEEVKSTSYLPNFHVKFHFSVYYESMWKSWFVGICQICPLSLVETKQKAKSNHFRRLSSPTKPAISAPTK